MPIRRGALFEFDRRQIVGGLGAALLAGAASPARAQAPPLLLRIVPGSITVNNRSAQTWSLDPPGPIRVRRGDTLALDIANELPVPVALNWHGLDGEPGFAPLTAVPPLAAGARTRLTLTLKRAGTLLFDLHLLGDRQARPLPAGVIVVEETEKVIADRDEVLLFEEWRLGTDGVLRPPGVDAAGTTPAFTVNGRVLSGPSLKRNERLRLRLVNASPRSMIAVKMPVGPVTVIATDGVPAEPFPARDGELVLAPGTRIDVVIDGRPEMAQSGVPIMLHDGTAPRLIGALIYSAEPFRPAPLPAVEALAPSGLPERLDLQRALRVDMPFDGTAGDWSAPGELNAASAAAFRVKRGRVVVVTLTNRATAPAVFRLHGHHARLLDRLDDGWKPFWLDTIAVGPGQTQRIAFLADTVGNWLIEGMMTQWSASRLARWFAVEA